MYWVFTVGSFVPKGFDGLSFFPFLFIRDKKLIDSKVFVNHEKIHLRQQLEMLVLFFYVWYLLEFAVRWIQYGSKHKAYRAISFEKEAYRNEMNLDYLKKRRLFSFIKYF